ncbi:sensor histidine kinase [Allonocardiopsis opalescens]|uniref:histidine kinase n=1 Tax=Allonocardiopsis opalescens TaxID=1144618 RepID=A0A2T0Q2R0_9ACTN|nr:HAMP domain-containing sensor histidine kinase [Allonocardiopsis opalescens]PRX98083.1 signal transduction histidine kinase [Allonocardiopsis opalescens]
MPDTPRRWWRTLRVRVTALVTVAVAAALAVASVVLVLTMRGTLIGEVRQTAEAEVARVAAELEQGRTPTEGEWSAVSGFTMIQVRDEQGRLLAELPEPAAEAAAERPAVPDADGGDAAERRAADADASPGPAADELVVAERTVTTPDGVLTVVAASRIGPAAHGVDLVVNALMVAAPLLTLFVAVLAWFAVDRSLRPIEAVRRRAEAISHANLGERLPQAATGDEVERLTATLNAMLDRLDAGARRQREFVSDASHELRTPLAAMRAEIEVARAHGTASGWRATADRLLADHRRIERLTGDLLLLARFDDGSVARRAEPVRLDELVAGELAALTRAEAAASLRPVQVRGVPAELARLVRNLLDNADRYSAGRVAVTLAAEPGSEPGAGTAVLTVDDDGPGIPPDQRERVFDRFYRLDGSRDRSSGGTGLGLALARRIARAHDGDVVVAAAPLGGARFTVRLPAAD